MSALAISPVRRAVRFYEAPIGKKVVMAITGLILFGYVIGHLLGNLQIYASTTTRSTTMRPFCIVRRT